MLSASEVRVSSAYRKCAYREVRVSKLEVHFVSNCVADFAHLVMKREPEAGYRARNWRVSGAYRARIERVSSYRRVSNCTSRIESAYRARIERMLHSKRALREPRIGRIENAYRKRAYREPHIGITKVAPAFDASLWHLGSPGGFGLNSLLGNLLCIAFGRC